jgi:hypothetical protein
MDDAGWVAVGKFLDLLKLVIVVGLLVGVGYGLLNLDAVLKFAGQAIDLLKAAR